ncbi:MAG TPA: hypothetical protein PKM88_15215 [bacterium]|nr:hypothetical protein [bacterium]
MRTGEDQLMRDTWLTICSCAVLLALLVLVLGARLLPLLLLVPLGYAVWRLLWRAPAAARPQPLTGLLLAPPLGLAACLLLNLILDFSGASFIRFLLPACVLAAYGAVMLLRDLVAAETALRRCWRAAWPAAITGMAAVLLLAGLLTATPNRFMGGADDGGYTSTIYSFYERGGLTVELPLLTELAGVVEPRRLMPISYTQADHPGRAVPIHPLGFPLMAAPLYEIARQLIAPLDAVMLPYQFCGLWALVLVMAVAREVHGWRMAMVVGLLLAVNWLQVWLARSAFGEMPLQLFGMAVLWLLLRARRHDDLR